jgi:hypothetical protein
VFPINWNAPSVNELREYLANPAKSGTTWHWWLRNDELRQIVLDVALVAGNALLQEEKPEDAALCWRVALDVAKDLHGAGPPLPIGVPKIPSSLVIEGNLVLLHFQYPKVKRGVHDFQQLFIGDMAANGDKNFADIQEYHIILGMVFAAQGKWVVGEIPMPLPELGLGFTRWGAISELEAGLKVSEKRNSSEHFYQPLARVKSLLGQGYQVRRRKSDAQNMYLRAAVAYLDTDALPEAAEMLSKYRGSGGAGGEATSLDDLIHYRNESPMPNLTANGTPWLFKSSGLRDEQFLSRERFKIFADLAGIDGPLSQADRRVQVLCSAGYSGRRALLPKVGARSPT